MAWRIHDSVICGEVDNREKRRVRGHLWIASIGEPVNINPEGNACADLAGCLPKFRNRVKPLPMRKRPRFDPVQCGRIGAIHRSRTFAADEALSSG
jgi:hypothetical protein